MFFYFIIETANLRCYRSYFLAICQLCLLRYTQLIQLLRRLLSMFFWSGATWWSETGIVFFLELFCISWLCFTIGCNEKPLMKRIIFCYVFTLLLRLQIYEAIAAIFWQSASYVYFATHNWFNCWDVCFPCFFGVELLDDQKLVLFSSWSCSVYLDFASQLGVMKSP